jgi:hypothetical protein
MAIKQRVPNGFAADPNLPYQPYDATEQGASTPSQSNATQVYDSNAGSNDHGGWVKIQDGGKANMDGTTQGGWPDNGTSDGSKWKQT